MKNVTLALFYTLLLIIVFSSSLQANNMQVGSISLGTNDYVNKTLEVNFTVSWENSWRTSTLESNYDAAWVILKYKVEDPSNPYYYSHAKLKSSGHTAASGSVIDVANGLQGAMVHRDVDGIGNVSFTMTLIWDYGAAFLNGYEGLTVQVIATEMVYIPEGAFYVGDASPTTEGRLGDGTGNPFLITSEGPLTLGGGGNNLNSFWSGSSTDDFNSNTTQSLPADYPKGFASFYVMKYEMSNSQLELVLNATRNSSYLSSLLPLNLIDPSSWELASSEFVPSYFAFYPNNVLMVQVFKHNIYDWYGMRVMSELEYEKICRGPKTPLSNEYPWGDAFISNQEITNIGFEYDEIFGNAIYSGTFLDGDTYSPSIKQVGYFARYASPKSIQITGSTHYGVMEMAGLAAEPVISISSQSNRLYSSSIHGDGDLNTPFTSFLTGSKGGNYLSSAAGLKTSSRIRTNSINYAPSHRMVISDF